jgi:hypothetical protein
MGQGHGGKGEPKVSLFLQRVLQSIGAAENKSHFFEAGAAPFFQRTSKSLGREGLPSLVHHYGKNPGAEFLLDPPSLLLDDVFLLPPGRDFFLWDDDQVEGRIPSDSLSINRAAFLDERF